MPPMGSRRPRAAWRATALVMALLVLNSPWAATAQEDLVEEPLPNARATLSACKEGDALRTCGDIGTDRLQQLMACCESKAAHGGAAWERRRSADARTAASTANAQKEQGQQPQEGDEPPAPEVARPDLQEMFYGPAPRYLYGKCTEQASAAIPVFGVDPDTAKPTVRIESQTVPALRGAAVSAVSDRALANAPPAVRARARDLRVTAKHRRSVFNWFSGFSHPGGYIGASDVALMQARLAAGAPLQVAALDDLLNAASSPKYGTKIPIAATPEGYGGPYAMKVFEADYYGFVRNISTCPPNYPRDAPKNLCSHISLVEIDAPMAYRQAMAYAATGDARHAQIASDIISAWATTNKEFGLKDRNGPLEAAWACAPMARAMDLLRATWPGFSNEALATFLAWVDGLLMPQMDFYIDKITPNAVKAGKNTTYGNWHASIADCYMAVGVLGEDRGRYNKGLALYRKTVQEYFKWGRGYAPGRILGEATETLRDIYHTLFAIGSLTQAAETAWGQNENIYDEADYVLAAAMELHARIINADAAKSELLLPPGFAFDTSLPPPPPGCSWRWDIESQARTSVDKNGTKCSDLDDGVKYAVGIRYLPNGFELGYNHFVGRLGMQLPETAKLLAANPVDGFTFSWGLATLTLAGSAKELWRPGVRKAPLCAVRLHPFITLTPPSVDDTDTGLSLSPPGLNLGHLGIDLTLPSLDLGKIVTAGGGEAPPAGGGGSKSAQAAADEDLPANYMPDAGDLSFGDLQYDKVAPITAPVRQQLPALQPARRQPARQRAQQAAKQQQSRQPAVQPLRQPVQRQAAQRQPAQQPPAQQPPPAAAGGGGKSIFEWVSDLFG